MDLIVKLRACFQNLSTIARKAKVAAVDDLLQKAISEPLETRTMLTAVSLSGDAGATSIDIFNNAGTVEFFQNEPTTATPTVSVAYTDLGPINITGEGPTTITLDFSGGDVAPAGLTFTGQSSAFSPNSINVIGLPSASDVLGNGTLAVSGTVPSAVNSSVDDDAVTFSNVPVINLTSSANVEITSGAFTFNTDFGDTNLTVDSGASVAFATSQHLNSLNIANSASVSMVPAGGLMLDTNTLSVQGTLDLTDNDMVVNAPSSTAMTTLQEQVADGLNGTNTAGGGIIESSTALQDSNMTIGVAPAAALATMNQPLAILDGQGIDPQNALIFRYVLKGDANLDGVVNSSDFQDMLIYFNTSPGTSPPVYYHGDFNYSGTVDDSDFQDLLINYNVQSSPTPSTVYAGASFQVSLPTTYDNVAIQRWDFNWGDGSFDSYGQGTTASSHVYTTTGNMLIQMSGILANGTVDRPAAIWLVVSPGTSTTVSINTAVNNDDNFTIAADGNGNTLFTETDDTGYVVNQWTALTSSLLSLSITGDAEGTTTVDFTNGNPLPASGLSVDSTQVNFVNGPQSTAGYSSLITSTTSVLFSNGQTGGVDVRYPASTVVSDLNTLNQDAITAVAGTTTLGGAQPATGSDGPEVFVDSGATLLLSGSQRFSNLLILRQATARMEQDGSAVLETDNLGLYARNIPNQFSGSVLDLADNAMIVHGGNYNSIAQYLTNGYDNGKWDGETASGGLTPASIISSVAAADTTQTQALGYAQIGSLTTLGQLDLSSFDGTAVSPGDVVVAFTTYGDANLDSVVGSADLAMMENGYNNGLTGWTNGDFNYDGVVDSSDTSIFYEIYVPGPTNLTATPATATATEIDLSWTDHASNSTDDFVYESTDGGGTFNPIGDIAPSPTGTNNTYQVTGLNAGSAYAFYIAAQGSYGQSDPSNDAAASTPFEAPTLDVEGTGTVVEGQPYELDLTANYPDGEPGSVSQWLVDWQDGPGGTSNVSTYTYAAGADPTQPLVVSHTFAAGIASPNVVVTAVDSVNGQWIADPQPVTVTPIAPTLGSVTASGNSITVNWANSSSISTGTTVLLSTDGTNFFEYAGAGSGATTTTITDLNLNTQYWVQVLTNSVNGISASSSTASLQTLYVPPTLVVTPQGPFLQGQPYMLALSATYAPGTLQSDMITSWQVNWGDGTSTVQNYDHPAGIFQSPTNNANLGTDTLQITATDASGRVLTASAPTVAIVAPPSDGGVASSSPYYSIQLGDGGIVVGGTCYLVVQYTGPTDMTLSYTSSDPSVMAVVGAGPETADGYRQVEVQGVSVGSAEIIASDTLGDVGTSGTFGTSIPGVTVNTPNETEGATYGPNDTIPGFNFNLDGATSLTPVQINFTTAGSTLPNSLWPNLTSGSVTVPAGVSSLFVPFPVADDGKIAPTRAAVVTLTTPGDLTGVGNQTAIMNVVNTDLPEITVDGQNSGAIVPLDFQDAVDALDEIAMAAPRDGTLNYSVFTWDPSQDLIWPTQQVGTVGVNDLASLPDATTGPNNTEQYTFFGCMPTTLWAQPINGSVGIDSTFFAITDDVAKPATPVVPAQKTDAGKNANQQQQQYVIVAIVNDSNGLPTGAHLPKSADKKTEPSVVVGQKIATTVRWDGPAAADPMAGATKISYLWQNNNGVISAGFSITSGKDTNGNVVIDQNGNGAVPVNNTATFNFMWVTGTFTGDDESIQCTLSAPNKPNQKVLGFFNVFRPNYTVSTSTESWRNAGPNNQPGLQEAMIYSSATTDGITFQIDPKTKEPAGFTGGTSEWVQIVNNSSVDSTPLNGKPNPTIKQKGLDTSYPYNSFNKVKQPVDSPNYLVDGTKIEHAEFEASFTMYLMWEPPATACPLGSDFVPIQKVDWSIDGVDDLVGNMWKLTVKDEPKHPVGPNGTDTTDYPTWTNVAKGF